MEQLRWVITTKNLTNDSVEHNKEPQVIPLDLPQHETMRYNLRSRTYHIVANAAELKNLITKLQANAELN